MAPINGKPFLHYLFKELQHQNIQQVILSVGHLKEIIQDFFTDNYLGISVQYAIENEPLGTGGGIKNAVSMVSDDAYILNGDTYFDIELSKLKDCHADINIALKPMFQFNRYGTVEINNEQRISSFLEKKYCEHGLINGGIYYLHKKLFEKISVADKFSFEKDVLEKHVDTLIIKGKIFDNYFIDIGIPEDYQKAIYDFK